MAEDWAAIAAEVAAAIGEVGFGAILEKQVETGDEYDPARWIPDEFDVTVIDDQIRVRDAAGVTTGETRRVLTIGATGVVPAKGDWMVVRGERCRIGQVAPLAPGGVDLLYDCTMES